MLIPHLTFFLMDKKPRSFFKVLSFLSHAKGIKFHIALKILPCLLTAISISINIHCSLLGLSLLKTPSDYFHSKINPAG